MTRKAISTDNAPAALGPYSQAIVAGGLVFCSGTAGIDPATGVPGPCRGGHRCRARPGGSVPGADAATGAASRKEIRTSDGQAGCQPRAA